MCFSTYYYYVPTFTIPTALLFPPPPPPAPFRSPTFFSHARQGGKKAKASRVRDGRRRGRAKRNNARSGSGGKRKRKKGERGRKTILTSERGEKGGKGGGLLGGRPSRSPLEEEAEASSTIAANDTRFLPLLYTLCLFFIPPFSL